MNNETQFNEGIKAAFSVIIMMMNSGASLRQSCQNIMPELSKYVIDSLDGNSDPIAIRKTADEILSRMGHNF